MNTNIRNFENAIINFINQSDLSIEIKRIVLYEIYSQLKEEADKIINYEINRDEQNTSIKKEKEDSDEQDI